MFLDICNKHYEQDGSDYAFIFSDRLHLLYLVYLSCSSDEFQSRGAPSSCFYTKAAALFHKSMHCF